MPLAVNYSVWISIVRNVSSVLECVKVYKFACYRRLLVSTRAQSLFEHVEGVINYNMYNGVLCAHGKQNQLWYFTAELAQISQLIWYMATASTCWHAKARDARG